MPPTYLGKVKHCASEFLIPKNYSLPGLVWLQASLDVFNMIFNDFYAFPDFQDDGFCYASWSIAHDWMLWFSKSKKHFKIDILTHPVVYDSGI